MQELIATLLQAIITVSTPIVAAFVVKWLNAKSGEAKTHMESELAGKYVSDSILAVANAVMYTSQTFVDRLKADDKWTAEGQKQALDMAIRQAKAMLTKDASTFLTQAYGDLNGYLTTLIEAEIKSQRLVADL